MNLQLDSIKNSCGQRKGSHVGFIECYVQKRFESDVYVNCKPFHRSKCVLVNSFEKSKECLSKKTETHFQLYSKKCNKFMKDSCFKAQKERLIKPNKNL